MRKPNQKKGRAPRVYDCFGERITAKEAADRLGISINTIRNRLQECGDNMEWVMNFYRQRNDKGEKDMRKTAEARAMDEIMSAIGCTEEPEDQMDVCEEIAENCEKIIEACEDTTNETGTIAMMIESVRTLEREDLAIINRAITVIEALTPDILKCADLTERLHRNAMELRMTRCRRFEHLVDWEALAKGESAE